MVHWQLWWQIVATYPISKRGSKGFLRSYYCTYNNYLLLILNQNTLTSGLSSLEKFPLQTWALQMTTMVQIQNLEIEHWHWSPEHHLRDFRKFYIFVYIDIALCSRGCNLLSIFLKMGTFNNFLSATAWSRFFAYKIHKYPPCLLGSFPPKLWILGSQGGIFKQILCDPFSNFKPSI